VLSRGHVNSREHTKTQAAPAKSGRGWPSKNGQITGEKKMKKKEVDKSINQLIGYFLFELSTFISIKNS